MEVRPQPGVSAAAGGRELGRRSTRRSPNLRETRQRSGCHMRRRFLNEDQRSGWENQRSGLTATGDLLPGILLGVLEGHRTVAPLLQGGERRRVAHAVAAHQDR